jgi:tryptophan synthase beta chain
MKKIFLTEAEIPEYYYNIAPDLPFPLQPPLHPGTKQPISLENMLPLFPQK